MTQDVLLLRGYKPVLIPVFCDVKPQTPVLG
jgi:hypothetical protein